MWIQPMLPFANDLGRDHRRLLIRSRHLETSAAIFLLLLVPRGNISIVYQSGGQLRHHGYPRGNFWKEVIPAVMDAQVGGSTNF
jgi:hypothetical protein